MRMPVFAAAACVYIRLFCNVANKPRRTSRCVDLAA